MAHVYYKPKGSNWAVGLPWWLALIVWMLQFAFYFAVATVVAIVFLCGLAAVGAQKGWRAWQVRHR